MKRMIFGEAYWKWRCGTFLQVEIRLLLIPTDWLSMRSRWRFGALNLLRPDHAHSKVLSCGVSKLEQGHSCPYSTPTTVSHRMLSDCRISRSWMTGWDSMRRHVNSIRSMRRVRSWLPERASQDWSRDERNGFNGSSPLGSVTWMRDQSPVVECATSRQRRHTRVKTRGGLAKFPETRVFINLKILGQSEMSLTMSENICCKSSTGSWWMCDSGQSM